MTEKYRFGGTYNPITCHVWNKERTQIAYSPNNNELHIYEKKDNSEESSPLHMLAEHDLRIFGIDWAPNTNRIATCSADKNAYVWQQNNDGTWKPTQVFLRINRAATSVKWSPFENKIAFGSGAKRVCICYFEAENDWWVSKHIKKSINSTITCLDWHQNNIILATGSTDSKIRVFSAFIKDIEEPAQSPSWGSGKIPLGQLLYEFSNSSMGGGWIHSVSFSGDGNKLLWLGHDSSINIVKLDTTTGNSSTPQVIKYRTEYLPFVSGIWISSNSFAVGGYDNVPIIFSLVNNEIKLTGKLDDTQKKEFSGLSAMKKFQSLDRQARIESADLDLDSIHQNAITCLYIYEGTKNKCTKFSTSGFDGQIVVWDLGSLEKKIANLKIQ